MVEDSGQIVEAGRQHTVDVQDLPPEALRGIIGKLNERSQVATRLFKRRYHVKIEDIRQLIQKATQEFHSCKIIASTASVSLILSKNERYDFRSWQEFEEFDTSQTSRTKSLQVEVVFDVLRNTDDNVERYSVQVSIQNQLDQFGILLGNFAIAHAAEFPVPPAPLSATVKYNNYILGKNLISTVEEWEKGLDREERKVLDWTQKHSEKAASAVFFFGTIAGILFASGIREIDEIEIERWLILSAIAIFTFSFFSQKIGKFVERNIDRVSGENVITLTKGDRNNNAKLRKRNSKSYLKTSLGFMFFLIQIALGVWAPEIIPPIGSFF